MPLLLVIWACAASAPAPSPKPAPIVDRAPGYSILNLYDAFGEDREGVVFDVGFAALVQYGDTTILFDAGSHASVLRQNCEALGVDLKAVDLAVLSHNHPAHLGGFAYLLEQNPDVPIYAPEDWLLGGRLPLDSLRADLEATDSLPPELRIRPQADQTQGIESTGPFGNANVTYVGEHTEIAEGITLIATTAELQGYFSAYPPSSRRKPTLRGLPEVSLSLETPDGEVLIVGCSHSGVDRVANETKAHVDRDVTLIMGGYNLIPYSRTAVLRTARRLQRDVGVRTVSPAHCTGHVGMLALEHIFGKGFQPVGLGAEITYWSPP